MRIVRQGTGERGHAWGPRWFSTCNINKKTCFVRNLLSFSRGKCRSLQPSYYNIKLKITGPCGGVPSVKITGLKCLALFAQSRVLARLISESRTVLSSSTCRLLIMLRRFVIPASSAPVNTPTSVKIKSKRTKLQHYLSLGRFYFISILFERDCFGTFVCS